MKKLFKTYTRIEKQIAEIDADIDVIKKLPYFRVFGRVSEMTKEINELQIERTRLQQELSDAAAMIADKLNKIHNDNVSDA